MNPSKFGAAVLPVIAMQPAGDGGAVTPVTTGRAIAPITLTQANDKPLRVVVANTSFGSDAFFAFDAADLTRFPYGQNVYQLQAGKDQVFVLAPSQRLFASSPSLDCSVCWHVSEAYPEAV